MQKGTLSLSRHLWKNRRKYPLLSVDFLKAIAKRVFQIPSLFAQEARIARLRLGGARIGELSQVGPLHLNGSRRNLIIGNNSFLGRVDIALHNRVEVGDKVVISDNVKIMTGSHDLRDPLWSLCTSPIRISDYSWIAEGAIILQGVTIGRGAVIGAGAVVAKDVPEYAVAVGNPAKIIFDRRVKELEYNPVLGSALYAAWLSA